MKRFLAVLCLIGLLGACDAVSTLKDGLAQSEAVASDLEKSVGSKPLVGFNWNNGALTSVSVNFQGIPKDKPVAEIADLARASIKNRFKQAPQEVVLGFSIKPAD
jgi:hypothetical protein